MRLRQCPQELPPGKISPAKGFRKIFEVELITPLYGGGVEAGQPDLEMPIRVSAIRGQLRFWWRLLNPRRTFQDETEIWGGISATEATASRVILSTPDLPRVTPVSCATYETQQDGRLKGPSWKHNIPGYALFPGQGELNQARTDYKKDDNGELKKPAKVILPPLKFKLQIVCRDEQELWTDEVEPTLRWWASFGGLGARTRRGLGSVKIADLVPVTKEEAKKFGCELVKLTSPRDATNAWTTAIGKLQKFRQGTEVGERRNPGTGKMPGRSRWPEADSIRQITGCSLPKHKTPIVPTTAIPSFPRAVFGLPIITHFKDGSKDCKTTTLEPCDTTLYPVVENGGKDEKRDRMASPLILKAMWTGKDYQPIALLLPHDTNMGLRLEGNGRTLRDMPTVDDWWPKAKRDAMTGAKDNPLSGRTSDVLKDFLDFFQGK